MSKFKEACNKINNWKKTQTVEFEEFLSAAFEEYEGLYAIVLLGITPYFNDGDICSHSEEIVTHFDQFINFSPYYLKNKSFAEIETYIRSGMDELGYEYPKGYDHVSAENKTLELIKTHRDPSAFVKDYAKDLKTALSKQTYAHSIYDTNYKLTIIRPKDGERLVIECEEYENEY